MANTNAPSGLTAVAHFTGGSVRADEFSIASGLAANIFRGDPVKSTGTGKNITVCAAGESMAGVFAGCNFVDSAGNVTWSPKWVSGTTVATGTAIVANVYADPDIIYAIQASAGLAETAINNVADITMATAGNATTGQSGAQLDSATVAASGSAGLKILGLTRDPNNAYGTNAKILVLINEHENRAALTAV